MVRLIDRRGVETFVAESNVEKYLAAGCKPAVEPAKTEKPVKKPQKRKK